MEVLLSQYAIVKLKQERVVLNSKREKTLDVIQLLEYHPTPTLDDVCTLLRKDVLKYDDALRQLEDEIKTRSKNRLRMTNS